MISPTSLTIATLALCAAPSIPAPHGAGIQEAAATANGPETTLGPQYQQSLAKLPVLEALTHVYTVLGQALAYHGGPELSGPRVLHFKEALDLPPSLRNGSALTHAGLRGVRMTSFEGTESPATDDVGAHQAVSLELQFQVSSPDMAAVAADILTLAFACDGRITVLEQSPITAATGQDHWYPLTLDLRCQPSKAADQTMPPKQLDAAANQPEPDAMATFLRMTAQNEKAQMGSLKIKRPKADATGATVLMVEQRFEEPSEASRAGRLTNFFTLLGSNSDHVKVLRIRSEQSSDGGWDQTFVVR